MFKNLNVKESKKQKLKFELNLIYIKNLQTLAHQFNDLEIKIRKKKLYLILARAYFD